MELQLIRSFVEVAESGSFAAASERLFITQSAVSLRIQRLEDQLGRPLFVRSQNGVALTAAGREFRNFALTILRNWEQARQRLAAADEITDTLVVGAQGSLWPWIGFGWFDRLRAERPDLALRAEMGRAEALTQMILAGTVQVALSYAAVTRPGLRVERLMEEPLVMVSPWPERGVAELAGSYLLSDWGPEFLRFHAEALPHLHDTSMVMALEALTGFYISARPYAAYLPARYAKPHVEEGTLHLVTDAPVFALPAWAIWREDIGADLLDVAQRTLFEAAATAEKDAAEVLELL